MSVLKLVADSCPRLSLDVVGIVVSYYTENEHKHVSVMADLISKTAWVREDTDAGEVCGVPLHWTRIQKQASSGLWRCCDSMPAHTLYGRVVEQKDGLVDFLL